MPEFEFPEAELVSWCQELDKGVLVVRTWAWHEWLWKYDPVATPLEKLDFNHSNVIGLCLAKAAYLSMLDKEPQYLSVLLDNHATLFLSKESSQSLSLRVLLDEVSNLQQQWTDKLAWQVPGVRQAVNLLFSRFGYLACHADTDVVMDDQTQVRPHTDKRQEHLVVLTNGAIRRLLNIFLVFYRSMFVHKNVQPVPLDILRKDPLDIKRHHIFAGIDDFVGYAMHWDLYPATKLNYIHDFPGLFNSVSQVIYYQLPNYSKRSSCAHRIDDIIRGELGALYTFPAIMQLCPDMPVLYTDSYIDMHTSNQGQRWLIADQHIYLISNDNIMFGAPNITDLAKMVVF
jgi:hypothetical protein